jgi:23S rRNA pseudouridine1911/1915/1917 synthase
VSRDPCPDGGSIRGLKPGAWGKPWILAETGSYLVVYKPPFIHSAPLKGGGESLLDWCAGLFPEVRELRGRGAGEGGILHRLDYETRGLLLIARTQEALEDLFRQQEEGLFAKEYEALSAGRPPSPPLPGFPPAPEGLGPELFRNPPRPVREGEGPRCIESAFRPYGPGRQAVRPLLPGGVPEINVPAGEGPTGEGPTGEGRRKREYALDRGKPYRTEIRGWEAAGPYRRFFLGIKRGFRHQIRCHLSWIGFPLLNDRRYGGLAAPCPGFGEGVLALLARGLSFQDPVSRQRREYRLGVCCVSRIKPYKNSRM